MFGSSGASGIKLMGTGTEMRRNLYIHGLRGALALAVFLFHVGASNLPTFEGLVFSQINFFLRSFEYGVEIFFGVSGIVIFFAYQKTPGIFAFFIERASRIFPVLWVTVTIILLLSGFDVRHQLDLKPLVVLGNLLALPPMIPIKLIHPAAWTISYEFLFYFFFIFFGILKLHVKRKIAISMVGIFGLVFVFFHLRAMVFLVGMAVAYAMKSDYEPAKKIKISGIGIFGAMFCWHLGVHLQGHAYGSALGLVDNMKATLLYIAATGLSFLGLLGVFCGNGLFSRILLTPLFQWLGTISFSLYMWHAVVMAIVKKFMFVSGAVNFFGEWSQFLFLLLALPPTLWISKVSQVYLEGNATQFVRRHAGKIFLPRKVEASILK